MSTRGTVLRVLIWLLLTIFFVPLFAGAGLMAGCFAMMFVSNGSGGVSDTAMTVTFSICVLIGLIVPVLIARSLRFGD